MYNYKIGDARNFPYLVWHNLQVLTQDVRRKWTHNIRASDNKPDVQTQSLIF
jgi:hypothetical protein